MMKKHYAPRTPMILCRDMKEEAQKYPDRKLGFLVFGTGAGLENLGMVQHLSLAGDPDEAATGLYAALHELDGAGLDLILAELLPEKVWVWRSTTGCGGRWRGNRNARQLSLSGTVPDEMESA